MSRSALATVVLKSSQEKSCWVRHSRLRADAASRDYPKHYVIPTSIRRPLHMYTSHPSTVAGPVWGGKASVRSASRCQSARRNYVPYLDVVDGAKASSLLADIAVSHPSLPRPGWPSSLAEPSSWSRSVGAGAERRENSPQSAASARHR